MRGFPIESKPAIDVGQPAAVFAALGDTTRLRLLEKLGFHGSQSITQLTADLPLTRQAVTKHLRVLQRAELIVEERLGRERRFRPVPAVIDQAIESLNAISKQWDAALERLQAYVEK